MADAERLLKLRDVFNRWAACTLELVPADVELQKLYERPATETAFGFNSVSFSVGTPIQFLNANGQVGSAILSTPSSITGPPNP